MDRGRHWQPAKPDARRRPAREGSRPGLGLRPPLEGAAPARACRSARRSVRRRRLRRATRTFGKRRGRANGALALAYLAVSAAEETIERLGDRGVAGLDLERFPIVLNRLIELPEVL